MCTYARTSNRQESTVYHKTQKIIKKKKYSSKTRTFDRRGAFTLGCKLFCRREIIINNNLLRTRPVRGYYTVGGGVDILLKIIDRRGYTRVARLYAD